MIYGRKMSQKLPVNNFEWIKDASQFNEGFIKNYNEESGEGCLLEADVQYREKLYDLHNDLPFVENFVVNFHDKTAYVINIRKLKQPLSQGFF